jgi:hypothetical protein
MFRAPSLSLMSFAVAMTVVAQAALPPCTPAPPGKLRAALPPISRRRVRRSSAYKSAATAVRGIGTQLRATRVRTSLRRRSSVARAQHKLSVTDFEHVGQLQYLAAVAPTQVWNSFGSWLRTIRPGIAPSELVVASALRQTLPEFLLNSTEKASIAKFILERQDHDTLQMFSVAS